MPGGALRKDNRWPHRRDKTTGQGGKVAPYSSNRTAARSQPGTRPDRRKGVSPRIPGKAAGPTSAPPGSRLRPPLPSLHKAGPEAGARPAGRPPGRDWTGARRPAAPAADRFPGASPVQSDGADRSQSWPSEAPKPGAPSTGDSPQGGQAHSRRPANSPRPRWRRSRAAHPGRRGGGRSLPGVEGTPGARPFAPNRGCTLALKSTPLVSEGPRPPAPACGVAKQCGGGQEGGEARDAGGFDGRPASGLPSRGAHTHTVRPRCREDRFCFQDKGSCCAHTKAAKTTFNQALQAKSKEHD